MPGDFYLYLSAAPEHDMNSSGKWWIIKACLRCAEEYGLHTNETKKKADEILSKNPT